LIELVYREKLLGLANHQKVKYKIDNVLDFIGNSDNELKMNEFIQTRLQPFCEDPLNSVKFAIVNDDK